MQTEGEFNVQVLQGEEIIAQKPSLPFFPPKLLLNMKGVRFPVKMENTGKDFRKMEIGSLPEHPPFLT